MPQPESIQTALLIHGIMCDENPGSHDPAYDGLFDLIQKALKKKGKPLPDPSPIKVEWGWNSGQSTENDRFLSDVERIIHDRTSEIEKTSGDFSILRPVHLLARQIMIFGFGDLFYYISKDGEQAVRCQVFQTLCNQIAERKARYKKSAFSDHHRPQRRHYHCPRPVVPPLPKIEQEERGRRSSQASQEDGTERRAAHPQVLQHGVAHHPDDHPVRTRCSSGSSTTKSSTRRVLAYGKTMACRIPAGSTFGTRTTWPPSRSNFSTPTKTR